MPIREKFKVFRSAEKTPRSDHDSKSGPSSRGVLSATFYSVGFVVLTALLWGFVADVKEVSSVSGEISLDGNITAVQPMDDGIVEKVLISNGKFVRKNDPILRLKSDHSVSEIKILQKELDRLKLREIRLKAEFAGQRPDFSEFGETLKEEIALEHLTFQTRTHQRSKLLDDISSRIALNELRINSLKDEKSYLGSVLETYYELLKLRARQQNGDLAARNLFYDAQAAIHKCQNAISAVESELNEYKEQYGELTAKLTQAHADIRKSLLEEQAESGKKRKVLESNIATQQARLARLTIRAPNEGVLRQTGSITEGSVVRAGQFLAEIVPTGKNLIAKVKIPFEGSEKIKKGDRAELRIKIEHGNIKGVVTGQISDISNAPRLDENGEIYIPATISVPDGYRNFTDGDETPAPGMAVEANIVTGSESVVQRLVKPIYQSLDGSVK